MFCSPTLAHLMPSCLDISCFLRTVLGVLMLLDMKTWRRKKSFRFYNGWGFQEVQYTYTMLSEIQYQSGNTISLQYSISGNTINLHYSLYGHTVPLHYSGNTIPLHYYLEIQYPTLLSLEIQYPYTTLFPWKYNTPLEIQYPHNTLWKYNTPKLLSAFLLNNLLVDVILGKYTWEYNTPTLFSLSLSAFLLLSCHSWKIHLKIDFHYWETVSPHFSWLADLLTAKRCSTPASEHLMQHLSFRTRNAAPHECLSWCWQVFKATGEVSLATIPVSAPPPRPLKSPSSTFLK